MARFGFCVVSKIKIKSIVIVLFMVFVIFTSSSVAAADVATEETLKDISSKIDDLQLFLDGIENDESQYREKVIDLVDKLDLYIDDIYSSDETEDLDLFNLQVAQIKYYVVGSGLMIVGAIAMAMFFLILVRW